MPFANADSKFDIDNYVPQENEVIIYSPVYNKSTGIYGGLSLKNRLHYPSRRSWTKALFLWL